MATRRRIVHFILITLSILVLLAISALMVVRSAWFHRYALALIVSHAERATGGRVEIGDFTFHRAGLRIDFYRVELRGTEPETAPPLFWADHIGLGLRVLSWLGRDITLNDLEIDHPAVHLTVDAQGRSNLPQPPSTSSKPINLFQLAVKYTGLNNGDVYYNDAPIPLEAQAHNLKAGVRYVPSSHAYQGSLGYQNAQIRFGTLNPLNHDLEAQFTATPSGVTLDSLQIHSGTSWIAAKATMTDYSNPAIAGSFQAGLSGAEMARVLKNPSLPRGMIEAQGTLNYRNQAGVPFIEALDTAGTFHSSALTADLPQTRASVQELSGSYHLSQGSLDVPNFKAGMLGGSVTGRLSMSHLATTPVAKLTADIHDVSLADARRAMRFAPPQAAIITGRLNAGVEASWRGSVEDLQARADATITAATVPPPAAASSGASNIPVDAALQLAYDGSSQVLTLTNTTLHTPHTTVNVEGSLGQRASLRVNAQSDDLHEIDALALLVRSTTPVRGARPAAAPQPLGLAGSASFTGTVQGSLSAPQAAGRLTATNLRYGGASFKTVQGNVSLSPSAVAIHQGSLQDAAGGSAQFDVSVGLRDWSYTPQSPIRAQVVAQNLQVVDLERITHKHYPVSGTLAANLSLSGSETSPAGQGSVRITKAGAWGQPIQSLIVKFQGTGTSVHATAAVATTAGSANVSLTYDPRDRSYDVDAHAPAIHLAKLQPLADRSQQITGTIAVNVSGRGTVKTPQLKATLDAPQLHVGSEDVSGLKAEIDVANQRANLTLASAVSGASIQGKGTVNLSGQHQTHMTVESQTIQIGPILAALVPQAPGGLQGQTQFHASLDGPLSDPEQVRADVDIPALSIGYQSLEISAAAPIRLDYRGGILTLQHSELKGTDTDLQLQGSVPIRAPGAIQMSATGGVDLHLIELMEPQLDTSGRLQLDVRAQGSRAHPEINGTIKLSDAAAVPAGSPIGLERVDGEIDIVNGRAEIKTLSGQVGGGTLTAHGFASYSPSVQFNLGVTAKGVRFLYSGVRTDADASLNLTGTPASGLLSGQVFIDRLSLTPNFDLASFASQFSGSSTVISSSSLEQNIKLNVAVASRDEMNVESSQLSVRGSVSLQVRGTLAEPVILGRTDIASGEVFFEGKRFQVQNGVIQFVNPIETEPVVNVVVTTTVQQFNLTLNFVGPMDRLRTTYTSDPPLSPVDIIDLLVSGRTSEAAQASPTTPESLLAEGLSSEVSSRVQKLVGISSLTIDPQIGGNQTDAPSQLAIQERVTKNLFFTFATDVTTTQGEVVQVEYQISRKYSVSAIRDQTGGYQVEIKMHKVF